MTSFGLYLLISISCHALIGKLHAQNDDFIPPELPLPGRILQPGMKPAYHDDGEGFERCALIKYPICQDMRYNQTIMPNWRAGSSTQDEAAKRMKDYEPLLNINCSNYLRMFLCTVYFPMCTSAMQKPTSLKPCKRLCLHVQQRCEPVLKNVKHKWPNVLSCDELPESPQLCVGPDNYNLDSNKPANSVRKYTKPTYVSSNLTCSRASIKVIYEKNATCLYRCQADMLYRRSDKNFAQTWLMIWAILCFTSSVFTFLAFITDRNRFHYPERPIAYLAISYLAYSAGYIIRLVVGYDAVACNIMPVKGESGTQGAVLNPRYLIEQGHENTWCTVVFLVINYFGSAASMWWLMLSLAWYLSACRKWSHEGVESVSSIFHMFAWALPAVQTILILILHKIDADELTGVCTVGNRDKHSLLYFHILPHACCLVIGLVFILMGFASVFRVRRDMKAPAIRGIHDDGSNRRRLEKLIAKLGVFTILYTVPITCLLVGHIYDYLTMHTWLDSLDSVAYSRPNCLSKYGVDWSTSQCHPGSGPSPEAGMLKIFTSLVVGITSGMWVWANKKTCMNFQYSICRFCFCQQPLPTDNTFRDCHQTNGVTPSRALSMNRDQGGAVMPNRVNRINHTPGMISSTSGGSVAAPSPNTQLSINSTVNHSNGQVKQMMFTSTNPNNLSTGMSSPDELSQGKSYPNMNGNQGYHVYDFTGSNSSKNNLANGNKFSCV